MKLEQKFEAVEPNHKNYLEGLVEVADEFAIDFANWVENLTPDRKVSVWSKNGEWKGLFTMDNEQLLEKYKKEKGL